MRNTVLRTTQTNNKKPLLKKLLVGLKCKPETSSTEVKRDLKGIYAVQYFTGSMSPRVQKNK